MKSTELYIYGAKHGYWENYAEFFTRSEHDIELVHNIMVEEITGVNVVEKTMLAISYLEDFSEAKRKEYENL